MKTKFIAILLLFSNLSSMKTGQIKLSPSPKSLTAKIIAHAFIKAMQNFTAIFIMTYVEDHWGDTVSAKSQLTP